MLPVVGSSLMLLAAFVGLRTIVRASRPFAYGEYPWRLAAREFRSAAAPALVLGLLAAVATAAYAASLERSPPLAAALAVLVIVLDAAVSFAIAVAPGAPGDVVYHHALTPLLSRDASRGVDYEAGLILMRRAEDLDRMALALFGESLVAATLDAMPPYEPAFEGGPDMADPFDKIVAQADAFGAKSDERELSEALRGVASALDEAREVGIPYRLVAVPPYPSAQALALMGSPGIPPERPDSG